MAEEMKKEMKEEVIRMLQFGDSIYFHQSDICRILSLIDSSCESINAKAKIGQALEIFSCKHGSSNKK